MTVQKKTGPFTTFGGLPPNVNQARRKDQMEATPMGLGAKYDRIGVAAFPIGRVERERLVRKQPKNATP